MGTASPISLRSLCRCAREPAVLGSVRVLSGALGRCCAVQGVLQRRLDSFRTPLADDVAVLGVCDVAGPACTLTAGEKMCLRYVEHKGGGPLR